MEEKIAKKKYGEGVFHPGARPMVVLLDDDGCMWLCDKDANLDSKKNLEEQGCWRCKDMVFTRDD